MFLCSQKALLNALLVLLCFKKDTLIMNKKSAASFNISKLKQVTENLHLTIQYCETGSTALAAWRMCRGEHTCSQTLLS